MTNAYSTISEEYRAQQMALHENPDYGTASLQYASLVAQILQQIECQSISDYGAGKCRLQLKLNELGFDGFDYKPYDPAFPEYGPPQQADLVCCIDVLEHIEPEHLDSVIRELAGIAIKGGFFTVHTGAAMKQLPDGRNAHLIQQPSSWWLPKLCEYFEIVQLQTTPGGFWVLVTPLQS